MKEVGYSMIEGVGGKKKGEGENGNLPLYLTLKEEGGKRKG